MDNQIARTLLRHELEIWRGRSYTSLVEAIGNPTTREVVGRDGKHYQIEIEALWDGKAGGNVRVMGCVDDGGWRAFVPLTDSFIMSSGGEVVGE